MQSKKLNKSERRYLAVQRILRNRNYGYSKLINSYTEDIYKAVFNEKEMKERINLSLNPYKNKEALKDYLDSYTLRLNKLFDKLTKYFTAVFMHGSSRVMDTKGNKLKFDVPEYKGPIEEIKNFNMKLLAKINAQQEEIIKAELTKGILSGKSYSQMADDIVSKIDNFSRNKAIVIARTETQRAHQTAMYKTMKDNGIKKYQWLSAGDDRVAPLDKSLHRHIFNIGEEGFMDWVGFDGKTYTIHKSPIPVRDSHINCRCVIVSITQFNPEGQ